MPYIILYSLSLYKLCFRSCIYPKGINPPESAYEVLDYSIAVDVFENDRNIVIIFCIDTAIVIFSIRNCI